MVSTQTSSSILLPYKLVFWDMKNCMILLKPFSVFLKSFFIAPLVSLSWNRLTTTAIIKPDVEEAIKAEFFSAEEINMVMDRLGISHPCNAADGVEILSVFDDEEPSLEEVKVAFDVFDENKDGFIDEVELQGLLNKLGQPEKMVELEECRNMIRGFDVNGDGLIDFDEFVKLMEKCSF